MYGEERSGQTTECWCEYQDLQSIYCKLAAVEHEPERHIADNVVLHGAHVLLQGRTS